MLQVPRECKKKAYEERVCEVEHASYTPLVLSATGGMANEATHFYKRLTSRLAEKWASHTAPPWHGYSVGSLSPFSDPPSNASGVHVHALVRPSNSPAHFTLSLLHHHYISSKSSSSSSSSSSSNSSNNNTNTKINWIECSQVVESLITTNVTLQNYLAVNKKKFFCNTIIKLKIPSGNLKTFAF